MSPKNDFTFKALFGNERNKHLLSPLLTSIIGERIEGITLVNPYLIGTYYTDKESVLDIKVVADSELNINIDIEMQSYDYKAMNKRMLYYWAKMYANQLSSGQDYELLNRTIGICIQAAPKKRDDKIYSCYQLLEKSVYEIFSDTLEIYLLNLAKPLILKGSKLNDELLAWLMFLGAEREEEIIMAAEASGSVAQAYHELKIISNDITMREQYEARERFLKDQATREKEAREEGREEGIEIGTNKGIEIGTNKGIEIGTNKGIEIGTKKGIEIGIEEGKEYERSTIARSFISLGLDDDLIMKGTGLDLKTIHRLRIEDDRSK